MVCIDFTPLKKAIAVFEEFRTNNIRFAIEEDFEESRLPYTVDLLDLNKCDPSFKEIIKKDIRPVT